MLMELPRDCPLQERHGRTSTRRMSPWEMFRFLCWTSLDNSILFLAKTLSFLMQVESNLSMSLYADNIMIHAKPFQKNHFFLMQVETALNIMIHADPLHSYSFGLVVVSFPGLEELASKREFLSLILQNCARERCMGNLPSSRCGTYNCKQL